MVAPCVPSTFSSAHRISGTVLFTASSPSISTVSFSLPTESALPRLKSIVPRKTFFAASASAPDARISLSVFLPKWLTTML